jgi:outer membrane protein OmpA-like peptidoglycan-associated protein
MLSHDLRKLLPAVDPTGPNPNSQHEVRIAGRLTLIAAGLLVLIASQSLYSQNFGGLAAPFLRISPNARQVGMGEAFTAMANEHNALRYNVAGLGLLQHVSFSINYHNWIDDNNQGNIEVSLPIRLGVLGFGLTFFDGGQIEALDDNFQPTVNGSDGGNDLMVTTAYSRFVGRENNGLALGAGTKFIRQDLAGFSSSSFGLDIGATYVTKYFSFGATWQNLSLKKAKFDTQSELLPQTLRFGVAGRFPIGDAAKINLATDVAKLRDDKVRIYTGTELRFSDLFAVRTGYKIHDREASRWALGAGVSVPTQWFANSRTDIDYAFSPLGDFETSIHRFSMTVTLGVIEPRDEMDPLAAKRIGEIQREMEDKLAAIEEAQKRAEEARRQAEAATRIAEMRADELERRLARIDSIALASGGKIEVTHSVDTSRINVSLRINFDFDKAEIRPTEFPTMDQIAEVLNTFPESQLAIAGHADSIGSQAYNIYLSQRRMESVMKHLVSRSNTGDRFFMPVAYGEMRPLVDNGTDAGRARNRRVDFTIFTRDAQPDVPDGSAITGVQVVGDTSFVILANGRVQFRRYELESPRRIVFDFPGIFNLTQSEVFDFPESSGWRARIGFHPDKSLTRVVFDAPLDAEYTVKANDNRIILDAPSEGRMSRK